MSVKAPMTLSMYHDKKACVDLMWCIFVVIQKKIINHIWNSPFYGVMIDKSTYINVMGHFFVFATLIKEGFLVIVFRGLL